jgi:hypothetical protein
VSVLTAGLGKSGRRAVPLLALAAGAGAALGAAGTGSVDPLASTAAVVVALGVILGLSTAASP